MTCCADKLPTSPSDSDVPDEKVCSPLAAVAAFVGAVLFTLLAASAVVTSDLPLPLAGL